MMEGLKHFSHNHRLILNEVESPVDKVVECVGCKQLINKLIDSFYSCSSLHTSTSTSSSSPGCLAFFMHKNCAELPKKFIHPKFKTKLTLCYIECRIHDFVLCDACGSLSQGLIYSDFIHSPRSFTYSAYPRSMYDWCFFVCLKCVTSELKSLEDRNLCHPGHNHSLTLFQRPALFLCDACNTTATDWLYDCTTCSFCMHKSCATAPATYECKFHDKHHLDLAYSLPKEYRRFLMHCSICNKYINAVYWLYYCATCRFFAHVKCASSTQMLSKNDSDEVGSEEFNLVHFPAADVSSLREMMQQFIINAKDSTLRDDSAAAALPNKINHWAHKQHQLLLKKRSAPSNLNWKLSDEGLLICDGCTKPISSHDDILYECNLCNYLLHSSCAHFPEEIQHPVAGKLIGQGAIPYKPFRCAGCSFLGNGIAFTNEQGTESFHIGCASLPKKIEHEAHHHPLSQCRYKYGYYCIACRRETESIMFGCGKCGFYIHIGCALQPHMVNHRWDPHPLTLILFCKDITDHSHEFQCEFCSKEIDPNTWFYHCSDCDQSLHMDCIDKIYPYPNLKFGATNIESMDHPHPHGLTYILNKKKWKCNECGNDTQGEPVLECSPCKFRVHGDCEWPMRIQNLRLLLARNIF